MAGQSQKPQPMYINRFFTGLYTQRNLFVSPYTFSGLFKIDRFDALVDGLNVELTNRMTLQRRPGFPRYCSTQLGVNDIPQNAYSFRNLSGTIFPMLDTNIGVYTFSTLSLTSVFTKSTPAQAHFQTFCSPVYMGNGPGLKKWNGATVSNWGNATPVTA